MNEQTLRRVLPAPGLSLAVLSVWLLLSDSLSAAQLLLGSIVALAVPHLTGARYDASPVWRPMTTGRRVGPMMRLMGRVALDIVRSNIELALRILGPEGAVQPGYVWVPVRLGHPVALTILAGIVTLTPGTVSADIAPDRRYLLVHAFDVPDAEALIDEIRTRYEQPLQEIFR